MPIWVIYHPPTTFTTPTSKHALATSITKIYSDPPSSLPAFYVNVNFIPVAPDSMYLAGNPVTSSRPFIRFVVDHIAINIPTDEDEMHARVTKRIEDAVRPHVQGKGWDWEFHVTETDRRLWEINGFRPPEWKSEGEKRWREEGRPVAL